MTKPVALVVGFGVSGEAAAGRLGELGFDVVASDDAPTGRPRGRRARAAGVELVEAPDGALLAELVGGASLVVPSPGVPAHHDVFALARAAGVALESEIGLAAAAIDAPIIAITGTNGKTTVATLVAEMLCASGLRAIAAGNIGRTLTSALGQPLDAVVVEVSSFQLDLAPRFRPQVGVWLNIAADHLDWHGTDDRYAASKFRVWENQGADDVAVANADDAAVLQWAARAAARVVRFGLDGSADYTVVNDSLVGPGREPIVAVEDLWRSLPHDVGNTLAASAAAIAGGASLAGVRAALLTFRGLPHRLVLVGDANGVQWYDDSKATNPHAATAAVRGFESVVLIAGGQNKGLDLSGLADEAGRVRAVVAIGASADEVRAAFAGRVPVVTAASMDDAVAAAAAAAEAGDAVLLSPGCASFDWYGSYAERGDDFARAVVSHLESGG